MVHTWCPLELLPDLAASHWLTVTIKKIYSTLRQEKERLKCVCTEILSTTRHSNDKVISFFTPSRNKKMGGRDKKLAVE
jgi:IS30 family transposase